MLRRIYDQQNITFSSKIMWLDARTQHKERKDRLQGVALYCEQALSFMSDIYCTDRLSRGVMVTVDIENDNGVRY